jgi:hypothetical protein
MRFRWVIGQPMLAWFQTFEEEEMPRDRFFRASKTLTPPGWAIHWRRGSVFECRTTAEKVTHPLIHPPEFAGQFL